MSDKIPVTIITGFLGAGKVRLGAFSLCVLLAILTDASISLRRRRS